MSFAPFLELDRVDAELTTIADDVADAQEAHADCDPDHCIRITVLRARQDAWLDWRLQVMARRTREHLGG